MKSFSRVLSVLLLAWVLVVGVSPNADAAQWRSVTSRSNCGKALLLGSSATAYACLDRGRGPGARSFTPTVIVSPRGGARPYVVAAMEVVTFPLYGGQPHPHWIRNGAGMCSTLRLNSSRLCLGNSVTRSVPSTSSAPMFRAYTRATVYVNGRAFTVTSPVTSW